jgi:hypothetical protein
VVRLKYRLLSNIFTKRANDDNRFDSGQGRPLDIVGRSGTRNWTECVRQKAIGLLRGWKGFRFSFSKTSEVFLF